ncbi:MAG: NADH:flavin oxidoreductase [Acidimicrobiaceae bacterium]|nr:NADH:flavin oxidoreductase [Acidimicrobiaceae bacterium]MYF31852.1 NADH:flavin oxidoreductase [Acidimicrobiaceae bacterium]
MPAVDPFAETRLGPVTLRNRIIKAATFEGVMPEALVTPELIEYHRAVAAGGAGMSTVAYLAVAPEGRTHAECIWLRPEAVPGLRQLTDAIHAEGAAAGAQIGHAGPVANSRSNKAASLAPSRRFNPLAIRVIRSATDADIARITNDYARAARLAADGGFDAIEIHLGHNYLLSAFLSPNLNKRTDAWGGTLDNRARFPRQAVQAVRAAVGDKLAVTAKVNMNDGVPGGLKDDESLEFARMLQDDGALDALELTGGSSFANPMYLFRGDAPREEFAATLPPHVRLGFKLAGEKLMPDYPFEEAYFLPKARKFLEALDMPLILLGGINRLDTVQAALGEGFAFVAMARALLRQPDLPNRWQAGTATESNCIHCNRCMPTIYSGTRCALDHPEPLSVGRPII